MFNSKEYEGIFWFIGVMAVLGMVAVIGLCGWLLYLVFKLAIQVL